MSRFGGEPKALIQLGVFAATLAACPHPARAGESAGAGPASLAEVVVTAEKRPEDARKVPISLSVRDARQLADQRIEDLSELAASVPGMATQESGYPGLRVVILRGVSSAIGGSTVGSYLDDVSMNVRTDFYVGATEPRFFDIDRIEVLRGPQGTLYGAASLGGTIRYISNPPDLTQFSAMARVTLSGTEHGGLNHEEQAVANIPLAPGKAALRLGFDYDDLSGYIDRYAPAPGDFACSPGNGCAGSPPIPGRLLQRGANDERSGQFRAALLVEPSSGLTIKPAVVAQQTRSASGGFYELGVTPAFADTNLVRTPYKDSWLVPSLTIERSFAGADLTSVTSYFWRRTDGVADVSVVNSQTTANILATPGGNFPGLPDPASRYPGIDPTAVGLLASPDFNNTETSQFAEELRLASRSFGDSSGPIEWLAGVYLENRQFLSWDHEFVDGLNATIQQLYGASAEQVLGTPFPGDLVWAEHERISERQGAIFGEIAFRPIPRLTLTAGMRYALARQHEVQFRGGYYNFGVPEVTDTATTAHALTPKFAVDFAASEDVDLYANATKGFRLGGANLAVPSNCGESLAGLGLTSLPSSYKPDSLWSFEGGVKSNLFDRRLSVSADGYYIRWSQVQQQILLPCFFPVTVNAGAAEVYGAEIEMKGRVSQDLTIDVSGGLTHAALTQSDPGSGAAPGERLLGVPEWTLTLGVDERRPLSSRMQGFIHADWIWRGSSHGAFDPADPDFSRPAYDVVNLSVGVGFADWEVSAFADNLFNQHKILQSPSVFFVEYGTTVRPLTAGMTVSHKF